MCFLRLENERIPDSGKPRKSLSALEMREKKITPTQIEFHLILVGRFAILDNNTPTISHSHLQTKWPTFDILLLLLSEFSGHFSLFGLVFFVFKSLLGIGRQWSLEKFAILTLKSRSPVKVLRFERGLLGAYTK